MIGPILIAVFSLIILLYLTVYIIRVRQTKETIDLAKSWLSISGELVEKDKKLIFIKDEKNYEILFFYVSNHSELTINSRIMWEIKDGQGSHLVDQSVFLSSGLPKIVIIYPSTQPIKRFINENELVFVKHSDYFYDMHVVRLSDLEKLMEELQS